eukprot:3499697-Rhodomonas_salina.5
MHGAVRCAVLRAGVGGGGAAILEKNLKIIRHNIALLDAVCAYQTPTPSLVLPWRRHAQDNVAQSR